MLNDRVLQLLFSKTFANLMQGGVFMTTVNSFLVQYSVKNNPRAHSASLSGITPR